MMDRPTWGVGRHKVLGLLQAVARLVLIAIIATGLAPFDPAEAGDAFEALGTALEVGFPLAAAICAFRQHRLASYATGFAAQTAVTQGFKHGLGDAPINERPNGQSQGFPSGHTAAAASGATDLAVHCAPGNRAMQVGALLGVTVVGASRIEADKHTPAQVVAGAALGTASAGIGVYRTPAGGIGVSYTLPF
jgi:membrane-associated phospholipid phosphatase